MEWLDRGAAAAGLRLAAIHGREPAAWIAAATAALPWLWLGGGVEPARQWLIVPVSIASGGLAAAAAVGDPPVGLPDGRRQAWLPLWLARAAWPGMAGLIAALLAVVCGAVDPSLAGGSGAGSVVGGAAAVGGMFVARRSGVRAAMAASGGLLVAAAAAGAALGAGLVHAKGALQVAAAVAAVGAFSMIWELSGRESAAVAGSGDSPSPALSLRSLAMVTAVLAMAVCFFLTPVLAAGYAAIVVGWFLCMAVPAATSGVGTRSAVWLEQASVGCPALPGSVSLARGTAVEQAVLLGWPAMVALLLPPVAGARAASPWLALGCLAGTAAALVATVWLCGPRRRATARAVVLAVAAAAVVGVAAMP